MENTEENSEKIGKMWKKNKISSSSSHTRLPQSSSSSSNSVEIPPKTRKKTKSGNFQMYHFIHLTLRLFSTPTVRTRTPLKYYTT